jgi:hypothetical protein
MSIMDSTLLTQQPWVHNLYNHPAYGRSYMLDVWVDKTSPTRK